MYKIRHIKSLIMRGRLSAEKWYNKGKNLYESKENTFSGNLESRFLTDLYCCRNLIKNTSGFKEALEQLYRLSKKAWNQFCNPIQSSYFHAIFLESILDKTTQLFKFITLYWVFLVLKNIILTTNFSSKQS